MGREVTDDLMERLAAGRLSKTCPNCGTREAASFYCTKCLTKTGPDDWHAQTRGRPASTAKSSSKNGIRGGRRYPVGSRAT